ncbi:MAG TPA: DUF1592 domain-containing protein [Verrucomicrobiae bacterium]|nr:DUF1592 domain-containing protein [Verrucomicrobiae bacterium]
MRLSLKWKCQFVAAATLLFPGLARAGAFPIDQPTYEREIRPLLSEYCFKCHGTAKAKGGVNLESSTNIVEVFKNLKTWQTVASQLRERTMPPEDKPQPSQEQRDKMAMWVRQAVDNPDPAFLPLDPGRVLIHRLSRLEYNLTVRDLLGVDTHPADKFPTDGGGGGGFDNNADTLFIPPILMERYLAAADEILDAAPRNRLFPVSQGVLQTQHSYALALVTHHATRAFRRPVGKAEAARYTAIYDQFRHQGANFEESLKQSVKALLVSPNFLFRVELDRADAKPYRVSDFELASRLSYFLWSSMPDETLFAAARSGKLHEPAELEAQTRRMLRDPKARVFAENFVSQWLRVRDLMTAAQPDANAFPDYNPELRDALYQEVVEFFANLLRENRSVLELLDANYTFANERVAKHYGIAGVTGSQFRKVELTDDRRGGVLSMGAVLTLTSYPRRTSPVLRGKWVLEEILGTPPPPPPPLVKSLPTDDKPTAEGLTFRQQLEEHRHNPNCAACHKRMDPLGFGLENFDAIGRWREQIAGKPVDASGVMATGERFNGPAELRQILLGKREDFVRNLSERMLSYALGRGLEFYDIRAVKELASGLARNEFRSTALVTGIVKSYPFQYRRNQPVEVTAK